MLKRNVFLAAAFVVLVAGSLPAEAQRKKPSPSDVKFMRDACVAHLAEIQLGKMAMREGSNSFTKAFGDQMVRDHTAAHDELGERAKSMKITLPMRLDAKHQAMISKFSRLSGSAFDRAYHHDMLAGHKMVLASFQRAARSARSSNVKSYATKYVPIIERHIKMLRTGKVDM